MHEHRKALAAIERMAKTGCGLAAGFEALMRRCADSAACASGCPEIAIDAHECVDELGAWLDRVQSWYEQSDGPEWPVRSWLFDLCEHGDDDCLDFLDVTLVGFQWTDWPGGQGDDRCLPAEPGRARFTRLEQLHKTIQGVVDSEARHFLEYVLCLGFVVLSVGEWIARSRHKMFEGKRVFVCWTGGDYVAVR
jgi:hypothetical protein